MSMDSGTVKLVRQPVELYLAHQLRAGELVRIIDDLVAQDRLYDLSERHMELVDRLHEAVALYVPDEPTRRQEPGIYVGEEELRRRAAEFIAELGDADQGGTGE